MGLSPIKARAVESITLPDQPPSARASCSYVIDCTVAVESLHRRADLSANSGVQNRVCGIEALSRDNPARNVIGAQQLTRCDSEHAKAEPRQFIPGKISSAPINALWLDGFRIEISRENTQSAVYVHQVSSMLVDLALHLVDDDGEFAALLDKASDDVIPRSAHAALRCQ
jgi:hypothetical protein